MDDVDMATRREELDRGLAINAALAGSGRLMAGPSVCGMCGGRNDRRQSGYATCSACDELPGWHVVEDAV